MSEQNSFRPYLPSTIILFIAGWGGLALLVNFSLPTLWPRWGLYALIILAVSGTTIPIYYWINRFLFNNVVFNSNVIVRESVSTGVYFALLAWFSIGRVLNLPIAIWLALGLLVIEYLLRLRENSTKPDNVSSKPSID